MHCLRTALYICEERHLRHLLHSLPILKNAPCRFDQWTAYGKVGGLDDQSMGWARYAQVHILKFPPC